MTTSSTYQGYDQNKPTSRVLRPPGGASSNIFGGGDEEPAAYKKTQTQYQRSNILDSKPNETPPPSNPQPATTNMFGAEDAQPATAIKPEDEEEEDEEEKATGKVEAIRPAQQYNPITGQAYTAQQQKPEQVQSSTRVRQPPGGASSGLW